MTRILNLLVVAGTLALATVAGVAAAELSDRLSCGADQLLAGPHAASHPCVR